MKKKKLLFIQFLMRLKRNCITFLFKEKYSKQRQRKTLSKNENTMNIDYINFENGEIKKKWKIRKFRIEKNLLNKYFFEMVLYYKKIEKFFFEMYIGIKL